MGLDVNINELKKLVTNKKDVFQALTASELTNPLFATEISKAVCSTAGKTNIYNISLCFLESFTQFSNISVSIKNVERPTTRHGKALEVVILLC